MQARRLMPAVGVILAILAAPALAFAQAGEPSAGATAGESASLAARAEEQIRKGQVFDAIASLEKAIKLDPGRIDLRLRVAGLEKKRAMWLAAAEQYKAVLETDPRHIEGRLGYAELLLADYQFRMAEENFRILLEQDLPHKARDKAQIGLGTALYATRRYREAVEAFGLILQRHPDEPTALAYTNLTLRKLGDLNGAARGWTRFLEKRPEVIRAQILLGEVEELRSSIVQQREKVAASPDDPEAHRILGDLLMEKPDLAGAISAYSRAADLQPEDVHLRFSLGLALRTAGHLVAAADLFRSLAGDREIGGVASYNLAYCERRISGPGAEAEAWQKAVESNPRDEYAYLRFIDSLARSDRFERELGLLLGAIQEAPAEPLPKIQYAILANALGRRSEAARALLDAMSLEPNDPFAQRTLRRLLRAKPQLGRRLLEEVSSGDEGARISRYRKAAIFLGMGSPERCVTALEPLGGAETGDAKAWVALASCRRAAGAPSSEVVGLLEAASQAAPDYLYARLVLAMAYSSLGRYSEAALEAQAAIRLSPDNVYALTTYGSVMKALGRRSDLVKGELALARSLQVAPMDPMGIARILHANVSWSLGRESEARRILKGDLPVEPEEVYRVVWEFVRDHYRDRTFNGQQWGQWRDRFNGKLQTEEDALEAVALMLASLGDRDTRLRSADQTVLHVFSRRSTRVDRDPAGRVTASSKSVDSEILDENVGYVAVTNMHDPKLTRQVEEALEEMDHRDAVILDLRGNPGGSEKDADAITAMLVEPGTPTGSVVRPMGAEATQSRGERPAKVPDKPIVVLVDRNTASSAEALAGALKESKRAVIVGETTYGKAGIQVPRLLPGGTMVLLATSETGDLAGVSYTGRGVAPDVRVDAGPPDADRARDAAILKAREVLRKRRMPRPADPQEAPKP
jgi:tetratricopeptide (TPR) repeat protein